MQRDHLTGKAVNGDFEEVHWRDTKILFRYKGLEYAGKPEKLNLSIVVCDVTKEKRHGLYPLVIEFVQ
jgi:hypothetical protein